MMNCPWIFQLQLPGLDRTGVDRGITPSSSPSSLSKRKHVNSLLRLEGFSTNVPVVSSTARRTVSWTARCKTDFCNMTLTYIIHQRCILFWRKLQASWSVLLQLLATLTMNEHIALCSRYKLCAANVTTNCVKFSIWSSFEQSVCF